MTARLIVSNRGGGNFFLDKNQQHVLDIVAPYLVVLPYMGIGFEVFIRQPTATGIRTS